MNQQEIKHKKEIYFVMPILKEIGVTIDSILCQDSPDIVIPNYEGRCIGIEVTQCWPSTIDTNNSQNRARAESIILDACTAYEEILRKEGITRQCVLVGFSQAAYNINQNVKKDTFISLVLNEIERHIRNDRYEFYDKNDKIAFRLYLSMLQKGDFLYDYVTSVRTIKLNTDVLLVSPTYTYWAKDIKKEHIEHRIKDKESKIIQYKTNYKNENIEEYWLVINLPVCEGYEFEYFDTDLLINNSFERVYITQMNKYKRLK